MKYPILIVKNNFNKKYNFKKGIEWFKQTPLELDITEIETSIPLTFEKVKNDKVTGYTVDDRCKAELRKLIPQGKYKAVCLLYGDKAPGVRVGIADKNGLYPDTDFIEVVKYNDDGNQFNHELLHTICRRAGIEDPMDKCVVNGKVKYYYNDKSLNAKSSNRTIALERLKPYWDKLMDEIDVVIKREPSSKKQTLGKLVATKNSATFSCETLELPDLGNKPNISCIPKGTYDVKWTFSPRFMKFTYEVMNVKGRTGIRFHSGNYYHQINGCILLGTARMDLNKDGELDVVSSQATIKSFEGFMQKSPFKLRII